MPFRLTVMEKADLTTVSLAGRLGDDAVNLLHDACSKARRPLVLDLSQVTGASDASVLLLHRLVADGVHLLGTSQYMTLLLATERPPPIARPRPRARRTPARSKQSRPRAENRSP